MVDFNKAFFIKLGKAGDWEERSIAGGFLRLGFCNPYHAKCLNGNYNLSRKYFVNEGKKKSVVTSIK